MRKEHVVDKHVFKPGFPAWAGGKKLRSVLSMVFVFHKTAQSQLSIFLDVVASFIQPFKDGADDLKGLGFARHYSGNRDILLR